MVRHPITAELPLPRFLAADDHAELALTARQCRRSTRRISCRGKNRRRGLRPGIDRHHRQSGGTRATRSAGRVAGPWCRQWNRHALCSWPRRIGFRTVSHCGIGADGGPDVIRRNFSILKPGTQLTADPTAMNALRPDSASLSLAIGRIPEFDLDGTIRGIDVADNHGSSRADCRAGRHSISPRRHLLSSTPASAPPADDALDSAVKRLLGMQASDGGFNLWGGNQSNPWITAYAVEFLGRAKAVGVAIPEVAFQRGLSYLALHDDPDIEPGANDPSRGDASQSSLEAAAYAMAVLAKNDRIESAIESAVFRRSVSRSVPHARRWRPAGLRLAYRRRSDAKNRVSSQPSRRRWRCRSRLPPPTCSDRICATRRR